MVQDYDSCYCIVVAAADDDLVAYEMAVPASDTFVRDVVVLDHIVLQMNVIWLVSALFLFRSTLMLYCKQII